MRCKTCHYSLANLTEHRCPECGTPFDPNDLSTTLAPEDADPKSWGLAATVVAFLLVLMPLWLPLLGSALLFVLGRLR